MVTALARAACDSPNAQAELDKQIAALLGPKTEEDNKPPEKKKAPKARRRLSVRASATALRLALRRLRLPRGSASLA